MRHAIPLTLAALAAALTTLAAAPAQADSPACAEISLTVVDPSACLTFSRNDCGGSLAIQNDCGQAATLDEIQCASCNDAITIPSGSIGYMSLGQGGKASQTFVWSADGRSGQVRTTITFYDDAPGEDQFETCATAPMGRQAPAAPLLVVFGLVFMWRKRPHPLARP